MMHFWSFNYSTPACSSYTSTYTKCHNIKILVKRDVVCTIVVTLMKKKIKNHENRGIFRRM